MARAKQAEGSGPVVGFEAGGDSAMVDLDSVEDAKFEVLPRGMYEVRVSDLTFDYSQASGNPMWTWELEVDGGDHSGRKLFFHTVFSGKGLPMTKRILQRIIPEIASKPFNPEEVANGQSIIGLTLKAKVAIKRYEGQPRNNVQDMFPSEGTSGNFLGGPA